MMVELLITLLVGAVLIISLNTIVVSHGYLSQSSRDVIVANAFAEQKIEALRSQGYLGLPVGTTDITSELPTELVRPRSSSLVVSTHTAAIKKIHMTITYNQQGAARTHTYTTLIGELGVGQF